jgi:inositol hexakisphosphate/diphosphoinositol-pentakisphosphate kinase
MKLKTSDKIFLRYFWNRKDVKDVRKEIKLKTPWELTQILDKTRRLLRHIISINESLDSRSVKIDCVKERERIAKLIQLVNILEKEKFEGLNRKVQLKPLRIEKDPATGAERVVQALFILKWGGELTHAGVT